MCRHEHIFTEMTVQRPIKQQADGENIFIKQYQTLLVYVAFPIAKPLEDQSR